jgi:predicted aconitase with swiveling domain
MKHSTLIAFAAVALAFNGPAFAQRSHPSPGGPPSGRGASNGSSVSGSHENAGTAHTDMSHASPNDVLTHNTVIAEKIKTLTGMDAQTACGGFKNLGQCVAAAHVAKNLNIPGGFDALKAKVTGTGAVSLGKAIKGFAPDADAKAETKKANQQASDDLKESGS